MDFAFVTPAGIIHCQCLNGLIIFPLIGDQSNEIILSNLFLISAHETIKA